MSGALRRTAAFDAVVGLTSDPARAEERERSAREQETGDIRRRVHEGARGLRLRRRAAVHLRGQHRHAHPRLLGGGRGACGRERFDAGGTLRSCDHRHLSASLRRNPTQDIPVLD